MLFGNLNLQGCDKAIKRRREVPRCPGQTHCMFNEASEVCFCNFRLLDLQFDLQSLGNRRSGFFGLLWSHLLIVDQ